MKLVKNQCRLIQGAENGAFGTVKAFHQRFYSRIAAGSQQFHQNDVGRRILGIIHVTELADIF